MQAELVTQFRFDAAHALPRVPAGHKCGSLHGHSYRAEVHIVGPVDPQTGWVIDFAEIKRVVRPLIDRLDHKDLGQVEGLDNSTSERLAKWLWDRIKPELPLLAAVTVWESETSRCIYRGQP
jgi:6-pyruvoyltetrahydropterin/6-carboxytetrahydropterin synthase